MTGLRLMGLLGGCLFLVWSWRALQRSGPRSALAPLTALSGLVLLLLSLMPEVVGLLSVLLDLGDLQGSRLITVLLLGVAVLWIGFLALLGRLSRTQTELDAVIRANALTAVEAAAPPPAPGCVLCVVPALNEAGNIADVLARLPETLDGVPVRALVVDDGSSDGTGAIAAGLGALVATVPLNRGQGAALRIGFEAANRWQAACVVTLDADGQNDPHEMAKLVAPVVRGTADLVLGSRILGKHHKTNWWRHVGVLLFSRVFNVLMGTRITDIATGYRAVRPQALRTLPLRQDQYSGAELMVLLAKRGARIAERPITFHRRLSGTSKKGAEALYGVRFAYVLLRSWLRPL